MPTAADALGLGHVEITPADPLDRRVAEAFDAHQRRATERGRLLGPNAVAFAVEEFRHLGAEVLVRASPWRLGPRTPTWPRSGSPDGWVPRASSSPDSPPMPMSTYGDVWRRPEPDS